MTVGAWMLARRLAGYEGVQAATSRIGEKIPRRNTSGCAR
jgi:hypothetical protein